MRITDTDVIVVMLCYIAMNMSVLTFCSTSGHHVSVLESIVDEASTVQSQVMPTTAESTDSMSSLVDTPVLDEYLHARVLDSAPM